MVINMGAAGQDPMDFNEETSAERIGHRIKEIRKARGMSQTEIESEIGACRSHMMKYEKGERKPKPEILKKIASILGVPTFALTDPVVTNHFGAMHGLFEMEEHFALKPTIIDGKLALIFDDAPSSVMNTYLAKWEAEKSLIAERLEKATSDSERNEITKEYNFWKWTFPDSIAFNPSLTKDKRITELDEKERALLDELDRVKSEKASLTKENQNSGEG